MFTKKQEDLIEHLARANGLPENELKANIEHMLSSGKIPRAELSVEREKLKQFSEHLARKFDRDKKRNVWKERINNLKNKL